MTSDFTERIIITSIVIPSESTNYEGLMTTQLISIDDKHLTQPISDINKI